MKDSNMQKCDNDGTKTQNEFKTFCVKNKIYCKRLMDAKSTGGQTASQPADFFIWVYPVFAYVEVKHKNTDKISLNDFTASQLKEAMCSKTNNILYLVWCKLSGNIVVDDLYYLIELCKLRNCYTLKLTDFRYTKTDLLQLRLIKKI